MTLYPWCVWIRKEAFQEEHIQMRQSSPLKMLQCQFVLWGCKYIQQCLHSLRPLFYFVVHSYMTYPFIHGKDLNKLQPRNMSSCRFSVLYHWIQYVSLGKTRYHGRKYFFFHQAHVSLKLGWCLWSKHLIQFSGYLLFFTRT